MNAVRAELLKMVTLPSLWITASLTWAVTLLLRAVGAPGPVPAYTAPGLLVFGVLAAAHEYQGGGQIRTTLLAMPRRTPLAAAKVTGLIIVALPVCAVVALIGGEARSVLPLTLSTLVAAGAGGALRNPVAGVGTVLTAYVIVGPVLRARFPASAPWLPDTALFEPGHALSAALLWAAATLLLSSLLLHRDP
ncbi:hypothetical protein [Actinoplanes sp. GCM10030250]|uniref:hypothetical protein n=1 Tax=Actinoplanes sp. GCM10030250 TaxID=3273376 RepID=UPI00360FDB83